MKRLEQIIIGCLSLILVACQHYEAVEPQEEMVELTLKLGVQANVSRGNVTDYPSNTTSWSSAEKVVDGRCLYKVSVYLVDAQGKVVASKDTQVDNLDTEVTVEFEKSSNLKRGIYTLMAVANHGDYTIGSTTYQSGLETAWGTIGVDADDDVLLDKKISSTNNISPNNVIQPLSLMKEIELHAGNNVVEGELIRTFARFRIEVKNNSSNAPLKINGLTFSSNFAQTKAYVFHNGQDNRYLPSKAAPVSTSSKALQPFTKDEGKSFKTIDKQQSAVVFDSYLLESKVAEGGKYEYTLDLAYEGVSQITYNYEPNWTTNINKIKDLDVSSDSYFLIYNSDRDRYLSAGESKITSAELSKNSKTVSETNVWQLISTGTNNQYYIKNVSTGLYMQSPGSSSVSLGLNGVSFTLGDGITMLKNMYIYINGSDKSVYGGNSNSSKGSKFQFYKVNKTAISTGGNGSISYNRPITLTTIDPITQQPTATKAIKRNDFINVLVTVSYNPVAGNLEFEVANWSTGGGEVEFN